MSYSKKDNAALTDPYLRAAKLMCKLSLEEVQENFSKGKYSKFSDFENGITSAIKPYNRIRELADPHIRYKTKAFISQLTEMSARYEPNNGDDFNDEVAKLARIERTYNDDLSSFTTSLPNPLRNNRELKTLFRSSEDADLAIIVDELSWTAYGRFQK